MPGLRMAPTSLTQFKAGDTGLLANLKPGDKVNFCAAMVGQQPTVDANRAREKVAAVAARRMPRSPPMQPR